jgi:hypothetical protein
MSGEHGEIMPHLAGATNAKQLADCAPIARNRDYDDDRAEGRQERARGVR